ncbi:MAG: LysM domain-containing protein [Gammaproteobacteria bacterium]
MSIDPTSTDLTASTALDSGFESALGDFELHVVERGETIEDIAAEHGVEVQTLLANNPDIVNPETLYPGQMLVVGDAAAAAPPDSGTVTVTDRGTPEAREGTVNNGTSVRNGTTLTGSGDTLGVGTSSTTTTASTTLDGEAFEGDLADAPDAVQRSGTLGRTFGASYDADQGVATVNTGASIGGDLRTGSGYGLGIEASTNVRLQGGMHTENGITTFTLGFDASATLEVSGRVPIAGATGSETIGARSTAVISMPEQMAAQIDPLTIDPLRVETMPIGTRVQIDSATYHGESLSLAFRQFAVSNSVTTTDGVSMLVERVGENQVRVTAGPTEAVNAVNTAGFDFGNLGRVMLGRSDTISFSSLQSAQFNLATPEGAAAYEQYVTAGEFPDQNSPGNDGAVSGVQTVSTLGYVSQQQLNLGIGPMGIALEGGANTGQSVFTSYPNGTVEHVATLQYSGNTPLVVSRTLDATGTEIAGSRSYEFTMVADEGSAGALNVVIAGDGASRLTGPVSAGDTVTWTMSEEQMVEFQAMTEDANAALNRTDSDVRLLTEGSLGGDWRPDTMQFAVSLARNLGGSDFGQAVRLQTIANAVEGLPIDNQYGQVPGSFEVAQ